MTKTDDFFSLTPERVLDAVESYGYRCTGRCLALNSLENRVYEVEVESTSDTGSSFLVVKFYRPHRWTKDQIQEEHDFLFELEAAEIAVVAPIRTADGNSIFSFAGEDTYAALFPKRSGRMEPESSLEDFERVGRLLARVHQVSIRKPFLYREKISPHWYLQHNKESVLRFLPSRLVPRYTQVLERFTERWEELPHFPQLRLHGDCHRGNILWRPEEGPLLVDFDDAIFGPMIQDVWLLFPGVIADYRQEFAAFIRGYEMFGEFDDRQLQLVELLRSFRMVQYSGWIARRWEDPAFQSTFSHFLEDTYWDRHIADLEDQLIDFKTPHGF